ncbi:2-phospho-L-lactate transferase [Cohaesibacter haloalkalitolerans]|uniref:2-phospho-L-lactate transferase n=1 Tax=Cohaesibacter haloalkalitolerans TaxID=1162980 RepID=UPI000E6589F3|nr:2-phospho-L-lactate transferase [Cohaesibacter haloalkalitolerans]
MSEPQKLKVTLLAGGVGGAKMAEGLAALKDVELTIIGNIADDDDFHGLWVSPDIDTMTYTLSGRINRQQGWGLADEGTRALDILTTLGQDTWMMLGDKDFGLHIYRTMRRTRGDRPTDIAADVAEAFGVKPRILLPTDDRVQTRVKTEKGWLSFQEYFVREKCAPTVEALELKGIEDATATPEALAAIANADLLVIAPSNPLVSIEPILAVKGIRDAVKEARVPRIAVSPLIAGKVVKGPADRMMTALGMRADVVGVAAHYAGLIDALLIDHQDGALAEEITGLSIQPHYEDILMKDAEDKARLARAVVDLGVMLAADKGQNGAAA